ncbi:hypothetical protein GN958_ATG01635 [Phytophthora infestans]|nr:hypothetical protein GN958_ATG01635 [Phytophthora infestans]
MRQKLEKEPLLSQARTSDRQTPLFLAAAHPDTSRAVQMIDLLMNNEAILGSRDLSKRHVLLYACHHGVEWEVVQCLWKWNAAKGGGIIKWSHCDEGTNSSLVLACQGGHTRLALRLLDEIDVEEYARQNDPFHVLEAAISTDDEIHAMAIAEHPKVIDGFQARDHFRYKGFCGSFLSHTVSTCTEAAIRHNMSELLVLMNGLNHEKVCKAAWHFTHRLVIRSDDREPIKPVILGIADTFLSDWRWSQSKIYLLVRQHGSKPEMASPKLQSHLLVRLPDGPFRCVIEFLTPRSFQDAARDCGLLSSCACIDSVFGNCPWHMYSPKANDYNV